MRQVPQGRPPTWPTVVPRVRGSLHAGLAAQVTALPSVPGRRVTLSLVPSPGPGRARTAASGTLSHGILSAVYTHRLMTTAQLHELCAAGRTLRWVLVKLAALERAGLIGRVRVADGHMNAWYLTPKGVAVAEGPAVEVRPYRITPALAAGPQQAHTLALNEAGLCFVRAARQRGDDCWPGWRNETVHHLGPGARADVVISDAAVEYTVVEEAGSAFLCRFLELDRLTYDAVRLVAKLENYARLAGYVPGWRLYPRFPAVVIVMDNARMGPERFERRMDTLEQLIPLSRAIRGSDHFDVSFTTLELLRSHGPFGAIFRRPGTAHLVDIRGSA